MNKIKRLEKQYRILNRKNKYIKNLNIKTDNCGSKSCISFFYALITSFFMSLIGSILDSIDFMYMSEANYILITIIMIPFLIVFYSLFIAIKTSKRTYKKIKAIKKKHIIKEEDLKISLEEVDDYLKDLELMSDEEIDKVPSFIVDEIIIQKKEKEKNNKKVQNSIKLKKEFLIRDCNQISIVNN